MGDNYAAVLVCLAACVTSLHCIQADDNLTANPTHILCPDCVGDKEKMNLWDPFLCLTNCTANYFTANDTTFICRQFTSSKPATLTNIASDILESSTFSQRADGTSTVRVMAPETRLVLCLPCHHSCKSCDGPSANDCLECRSDFPLVNRTCYDSTVAYDIGSNSIAISCGMVASLLLLVITTVLVARIYRRRQAKRRSMLMDDVKNIPLHIRLTDRNEELGIVLNYTDFGLPTNNDMKRCSHRLGTPDQKSSSTSLNATQVDTDVCNLCSAPSSAMSSAALSDFTDQSSWAAESGQQESVQLSQQGHFTSHLILCPEWQAVGKFDQAGGCLQKLNSDVTLHVPPQAVAAGETEIRLAVSTDLGKIRELLGLPEDVEVVTPFVECWAESVETFQHPVTLCLPHFLPDAYDLACVQVYHVSKCNGDIKICTVPRENPNNSNNAAREIKDSLSLTQDVCTFRIENSLILIDTDHFCGFCACSRKVRKLRHLFAIGSARTFPFNTDWHVDVNIYLWDERINIADFLEDEQIPEGEKVRICLLDDCSSKSCTMILRLRSCPVSQGTLLPRLDVNNIPFYELEQRRSLSQLLACKKCRTKGKFKPVPFKWALKYEQHRQLRTDVEFGVDIMHRENRAVPMMFMISIGEDHMRLNKTGLQQLGETADNHSSSSVDLRQTLRSMTNEELNALTQHLGIRPQLSLHGNQELQKDYIIDLCFEQYTVVQLADVIVKLASRTATSASLGARSRLKFLPVQETEVSTATDSKREQTESTCVKRFYNLNSTSTMESMLTSAIDVSSGENTDAKRLADCDYQVPAGENTEIKQPVISTTSEKKIANTTLKDYNQCSDNRTYFVQRPAVHPSELSSGENFPPSNLNVVNESLPSLVRPDKSK